MYHCLPWFWQWYPYFMLHSGQRQIDICGDDGMSSIALEDLISKAKVEKCGSRNFPVLSMTMHDGIVFQNDRFKKDIASVDRSNYSVVNHNQLVVSFPIDEGVLAVQDITDAGIVSPAYRIWDIDQSVIIPKYLEIWLRSPRSIEYYKSKLRGTTARRRSIPEDDFLGMPVSVPSMEAQRIAVDLIARVQHVLLKRQQQLSTLDDLIKARFVEMFGDPVANPKNLEVASLGELSCLITKGASPSWQGFSYTEDPSQTLFVTSENVREGYIDLSNPKYIEDGFNEKQKRSVLQYGDFLINIVGASIGRAAQFLYERKANINQAAALVRLGDKRIRDKYLLIYLNSEKAQQMYNSMKSDTGRANLSLQDISNLSILIPPVTEQVEFELFVEQVDKSKSVIQKSLDETQLLFDSLMQKYFG